MRVTIRLFAGYRERVGATRIDLDLPEGSTVGHMAEEMLRAYPTLGADPSRLVVAVNQEYRDHEFTLSPGDEVALIPPVSGGSFDQRSREIRL